MKNSRPGGGHRPTLRHLLGLTLIVAGVGMVISGMLAILAH